MKIENRPASVHEQLGFFDPGECVLERRVFRDDDHQRTLDERGYVVAELLSAEQTGELRDFYQDASDAPEGINPPGAYNPTYAEFSVIHSHPSVRRAALTLMSRVVGDAVNGLVVGYRPLIANFVNKPPGTGVVPAHQNFSVVDERRFQSLSVWVALVDCTIDNGAMWMLDGSHQALRGRRGLWAYEAFSQLGSDWPEGVMTPLEVPAGHAVILDDAVVHYSPPNLTGLARLAIQFVMVPNEAQACWFHRVGGHGDVLEIAEWKVTPEFFFEFWHGDGDERFAERAGIWKQPASPLDLTQIEALMRDRCAPQPL